MSSHESRLEIAKTVIERTYRDQCVDNALAANVIDAERATMLKGSDNLQQVLDALGEDLQAYGLDNGLTPAEFDILCSVVLSGPLDFI